MLKVFSRPQSAVAAVPADAATATTSSDAILVNRIAAGDKLAMQALFARHRTPVYRWLLRLVSNETLAEDLLSEVFDFVNVDCALQGALGTPPPNRCGIGRED